MTNDRQDAQSVLPAALPLVTFGPAGTLVTKLGFGGIPIQQLPDDEAIAVVRACFAAGVRVFDTARGYTNSEGRIGIALKGLRDQVFLVTKSPAKDLATLQSHFTTSLSNLQTDYVDLFLFHNVSRPDHLRAILDDGLLAWMRAQQAAGRTRLIGISSHNADVAAECLRTGEFAALEFPYNYLEDQAEPELLPLCRERSIGFLCMKPLAGGALSNGRAAIKWAIQQPDVVVIPGLMSLHQVNEAVQSALDPRLTADELAAIDRDRRELSGTFCRRCGYCLPCPQGIQVNSIVSAELFLNRTGWHRADAKYLQMLDDAVANCIECGECESRCPYNLPLASLVKQTAARVAARARAQMERS
jgi:hypothetical protein